MANKKQQSPKGVIKNPIKRYNDSLSEDQAQAKKIMKNHAVITLRGKAGTGKSFMGVCYALERWSSEHRKGGIDGIVITRAMVTKKNREMGFLPGDMLEKIDPWITPIKEIVNTLQQDKLAFENMLKDVSIEIVPLAVVKGRTFTNKIVLVDEAADLTEDDIKALFTRIGKNSQMVFMGDMDQCDLSDPKQSGFPKLCKMYLTCSLVGDFELTTNFRHEVVIELLKNYK